MLKKLLLVYNPRSSHHAAIEQEVLGTVRGLRGWMVGKYAIKPQSFAANVDNLVKLLNDGDLVIIAGGDGTATMAINGILMSQKKATVAVLGYGNFNDISGMLGAWNREDKNYTQQLQKIIQAYEQGLEEKLYPLEVIVNDVLWRFAPCYTTIGLLAQATAVLEEPKVREKLDAGKSSAFFSLRQAVKWYLKHHRYNYLPAGKLNGKALPSKATDYLAVNGPTMAKLMKAEARWRESQKFGSSVQRLGSFWRMIRFGLKSITSGIPLEETKRDLLEFSQPSTVGVHVEGEFEQLERVEEILVQKSTQSLKVITRESLQQVTENERTADK